MKRWLQDEIIHILKENFDTWSQENSTLIVANVTIYFSADPKNWKMWSGILKGIKQRYILRQLDVHSHWEVVLLKPKIYLVSCHYPRN